MEVPNLNTITEHQAKATEHHAAAWEILKDPQVWQEFGAIAAALGHTVAAGRFGLYGAIFAMLASSFGPHPAAPPPSAPEEPPQS